MRRSSIARLVIGCLVILALTACPPRKDTRVVIPDTTVVVGGETLAALSEFDLGTGVMRFAAGTAVLDALEAGDVLVAPPSAAAPYGFLRKVVSTSDEGNAVVVETTHALLTEAISKGSFDAQGTLSPDRLVAMTGSEPGVESRVIGEGAQDAITGQALGDVVSEGYDYEVKFDVELEFSGEDGGVSGEGSVRAWGMVRFKAGFDVGLGIEGCFELPPVCIDRFEARAGIEQYVELNLEADIEGRVLEEKVLRTFHYEPLVFWLGPVPLVIVPTVDIVVGARGDANATFKYRVVESAKAVVGAKWTDPDDNGVGWQDQGKNNGLHLHGESPLFESTMEVRAYGRVDAQLLLYGVVGPGMGLYLGAGANVQIPRRPLWRLFGHFGGRIHFKLDLLGLVRATPFVRNLFEVEPTIMEAGNSAPRFSNVKSDTINVDVGVPVVIGPRAGFTGYFDVMDPEGDPIRLTAVSNVDGNIPLTATFVTPGTRSVSVTARDDQGASSTTKLSIKVNNSLPLLTVIAGTGTAPATTQYFLSATAFDPETGPMACSSITWFADQPDTVERTSSSSGSCAAVAVFAAAGSRTVRVVATDQHGGTTTKTVNIAVTPAPPNLPPILQANSFRILAAKGPRTGGCAPGTPCDVPACITGVWCTVPDGASIYNGENGDYHPPLSFSVTASDPEGDAVTVVFSCGASTGHSFTVTNNNDGTFGCSPTWTGNSNVIDIYVSVYATDGNSQSAPLTKAFYMLPLLR